MTLLYNPPVGHRCDLPDLYTEEGMTIRLGAIARCEKCGQYWQVIRGPDSSYKINRWSRKSARSARKALKRVGIDA